MSTHLNHRSHPYIFITQNNYSSMNIHLKLCWLFQTRPSKHAVGLEARLNSPQNRRKLSSLNMRRVNIVETFTFTFSHTEIFMRYIAII